MKNFKITVEYSGGDTISIDNGENFVSTVSLDTPIDDLSLEIRWGILRSICYSNEKEVSDISKDVKLLEYNPRILANKWLSTKVDDTDAEWYLFDIIRYAKTKNIDKLKRFVDNSYGWHENTHILISLCTMYRLNGIVGPMLANKIFSSNNIEKLPDIFHKIYMAAAISDNIVVFERGVDFGIEFKDIDKYLILAAKHKSQCVLNYILRTHMASQNAMDMALQEASKHNNSNIINNLASHGASSSLCQG